MVRYYLGLESEIQPEILLCSKITLVYAFPTLHELMWFNIIGLFTNH